MIRTSLSKVKWKFGPLLKRHISPITGWKNKSRHNSWLYNFKSSSIWTLTQLHIPSLPRFLLWQFTFQINCLHWPFFILHLLQDTFQFPFFHLKKWSQATNTPVPRPIRCSRPFSQCPSYIWYHWLLFFWLWWHRSLAPQIPSVSAASDPFSIPNF